MNKKYNVTIGDKEISASFINLAEKANGEAMVRCGDTVVFATATMSNEESDKDFFPLSVSYEEKFYAAGKISGPRFTRREGKPSERATLVSRMIDRTIRPKFPKDLKNEIQIIVTCLSFDEDNDPGILGIIASSLALHLSDIPWNGPLGAVKIGRNAHYILNPDFEKRENSVMDITISGFLNEKNEFITNMIEGFFDEEEEEKVAESFNIAEKAIKDLCVFQDNIRKEIGKEKKTFSVFEDKDVENDIRKKADEKLNTIFSNGVKEGEIKNLKEEMGAFIKETYEDSEKISYAFKCLDEVIGEKVRRNILDKGERLDGRKTNELRELKCHTGLLPRTHGSGLFQRGETKSLSIITLGAPGEKQLLDDMETTDERKSFMHHYNFPPYSVGETRPLRGPGRREIGHGILAENAIAPLIPDTADFPYTIRSVSEIVSSNGSTSMASVCGTTLALMDAGVPIKRPVAGISIGLITDKNGDYTILTDIQGLEDHYGDMDFKVAGTEEGVTAIQLDVKIAGLTKTIIKEALERGKETRLQIIEKIKETISEPREELSPFAPRISTMTIDKERIGEIIGPKGKTINEIIEKTGVAIDIEDSGVISISSPDKESITKAVDWIKNLLKEVERNEIYQGKIIKILSFGAVAEILPGKEGLIHISEISDKRIDKVEDEVKEGDVVPVKVIKVENGKISLSMKEAKKKSH